MVIIIKLTFSNLSNIFTNVVSVTKGMLPYVFTFLDSFLSEHHSSVFVMLCIDLFNWRFHHKHNIVMLDLGFINLC